MTGFGIRDYHLDDSDPELDDALHATAVEVYWQLAEMSGRPEFAGELATATCETPRWSVMSTAVVDPDGVIVVDSVVLDRPCAPSGCAGDARAAGFPRLAARGVMWLAFVGSLVWFSDGRWCPWAGVASLAVMVAAAVASRWPR